MVSVHTTVPVSINFVGWLQGADRQVATMTKLFKWRTEVTSAGRRVAATRHLLRAPPEYYTA